MHSYQSIEEKKIGLMNALQDTGTSQEVIKFYSDTLECELDIQHTIYKLSCKLKNEVVDDCEAPPPSVIFALLQTMTKHFQRWRSKIDDLSQQGISVAPLQLEQTKSNFLTAVCSLETDNMNMKEGEQLQITDSSHPNWLKVRTSCGDEGFLPTISCFVPTPDYNAITAIERLQLLLLTSWAECIRELRPILAASCADCFKTMTKHWNAFLNSPYHYRVRKKDKLELRINRFSEFSIGSRSTVDLLKVRRNIAKLENQLLNINICNGLTEIKSLAVNLDRAILCYESLFNQWSSYRDMLNKTSDRPVRIVEHWEELRRASKFKKFKFYEMRITLNESEEFEDIEYIKDYPDEAYTSQLRKQRQIIRSEKLVVAKGEEKKRYVIKGVIDPRTNQQISLKQAVADGIIQYARGVYINPDTGDSTPLQTAISERHIIVEYTSIVTSPTQTTATPLISIRRRADRRYTITGAVDSLTAERVSLEEAYKRGLIIDDCYINKLDNKEIPLGEAVEDGWVTATFDDTEPQFSCETLAVTGVLDRHLNMLLPFDRAVSRGLIEPDTGDYVDSGRVVYAVDAITNGWIVTQPFQETDEEMRLFSGLKDSPIDVESTTPLKTPFLLSKPTVLVDVKLDLSERIDNDANVDVTANHVNEVNEDDNVFENDAQNLIPIAKVPRHPSENGIDLCGEIIEEVKTGNNCEHTVVVNGSNYLADERSNTIDNAPTMTIKPNKKKKKVPTATLR